MGEAAALEAGLRPTVVYRPMGPVTTASDTVEAARAMSAAGCRLLLFAGGDGTARDICRAVGQTVPALGIPAGVKIHSAAFAMSPVIAGDVASAFLSGGVDSTREAEVVDEDEDDYRNGRMVVRLYGYVDVPNRPESIQGSKVRSPSNDDSIADIGIEVAGRMEPGVRYVIGPGTTAKAALRAMGLPFALLGVDLVLDGQLIGTDLSAADLLAATADSATRLVVSPIGGQGHIFGRGNQQLSSELIRRVGKQGLIIVASPWKLASLRGHPLFVDTGDRDVDLRLAGYVRIVTGRCQEAVYACAC